MVYFPPFLDKGDNFSDVLFASKHTKPILKRGLLQNEKKNLSFQSRRLFKQTKAELSPLKSIPIKRTHAYNTVDSRYLKH